MFFYFFCYPFYVFLNFYFSLRRAQAARGPYFLLLQKVGKDRRKGVSPPCGSPDQSGVLDAPLWKPPSLAALSGLAELLAASRLELRCRWGRPRARARSPRLPHLHRFVWGLRPLAPCVPLWGTFARHARLPSTFPVGERLPIMRASAWDNVRCGFAGNAFANLRGSSCREAARSSVTPLARLCRRHSSATARGNPKGGAALFGQSLPTFCWPESRGPRAARARRRTKKNF